MKATSNQKKFIHSLVRKNGIDEDSYRKLIADFSSGRTTTSADLHKNEAQSLISALLGKDNAEQEKRQQESKRLVGKIYKLSLSITCLNKDFDGYNSDEKEMNKAKLNKFLREHGSVKKDISIQTTEELKQTLKQLAVMVKKEK